MANEKVADCQKLLPTVISNTTSITTDMNIFSVFILFTLLYTKFYTNIQFGINVLYKSE